MKKNYLFYVALFLGITFTNAQKTTIPDETFRQFLIAAPGLGVDIESTDFDAQNQIDNSILAQITALTIPPPYVFIQIPSVGKESFIKDLTGIEAFTNLTTFSSSTSSDTEPHSFTEIDFSKNTELKNIQATNNHLVRLDLSNNTKLTGLDVSNNHLVNLNIANTNTNYWDNYSSNISVKGNYLSCVQVDANITENQAEGWNAFDSGITFRTTACDRYTYIPDTNFETALQNLKDDAGNSLNIDSGAPDKKVLTASISSITILDDANYQEVPESEKISDLTGIEDFSALTQLFIDGHSIKNIDLSNNKELLILSIQYNLLESISLENNIKITELILGDNQIDNLTVDGLAELKRLNIGDNKLTVFDISKNIKIEEFFIQNNLLSTLNIRNGNNNKILDLDTQNNPNLTCITVDDNFTDKDNLPNSVNWTLDAQTQLSTTGTCTTVQYTTITDAYFMQALIDGDHNITANDFDNDNKIETSKIENIEILKTTTDSKTYDIVTLQGLEDFKNLKELYTGSLNLETINVTNNILLEKLVFSGSKITSIDVSQNTALDSLAIQASKISTLNLENNIKLKSFVLYNSPLQELNLESNIYLKYLEIQNLELDIDDSESYNFAATEINLTKNTALEAISLNNLLITNIDLSNNTNLKRVRIIQNNNLTNINLKNNYNVNIEELNILINLRLSCIQVDDAFVPDDSWQKDEATYYSYDCSIAYTTIPDEKFRNALIDGDHNITANDFDNDNKIETSKIENIEILKTRNDSKIYDIVSLQGLEDFKNLKHLEVGSENLENVVVTKNTLLENIFILGSPKVTSLDIITNLQLDSLVISTTKITTLNLEKNTKLKTLGLVDTPLQELNLENNINLKSLYLSNSFYDETYSFAATEINLTKNTALEQITLEKVLITNVDLSNNANLKNVTIWQNNNLTSVNLKNNFNVNIEELKILANPYLDCIQVDEETLANFDTLGWNIEINGGISTDCSSRTQIPDADFRQALINHDLVLDITAEDFNEENEIATFRISAITNLFLDVGNIQDLKGIEHFIALTNLEVGYNQLSSLDVSKNIALKSLIVNSNPLSSLDVSKNTALTTLNLSNLNLTSLDVTQNTALTILLVPFNKFTSLDVSKNTALTILDVIDNPELTCIQVNQTQIDNTPTSWAKDDTQSYSLDCTPRTHIPDANFRNALINHDPSLNITTADFNTENKIETSKISGITNLYLDSKNISDLTGIEVFTALTELDVSSNQLINLDVSKNTALTALDVYKNQLTSLDVSKNTALTYLGVFNNQLTSLDISSNTILATFNVTNNPNLNCIQVNQTQIDNTPTSWRKDATATYSIDCTPRTHIPDANFRAAIEALVEPDVTNFNNLNQIETSKISGITDLYLGSKNISDLTGIEGFTALTLLDVFDNQLTSLDVSKNIELAYLNVRSNQLTNLDVSKNTALTRLHVYLNQLTSLDVSKNTALTDLLVYQNQLTSLDVSKNTALTILFVFDNQLTSLDVSKIIALMDFAVDENPNLTCIQVNQTQIVNPPIAWFKDFTQTYSTDCSDVWVVNTTDTALDTALAAVTGLDTNSDGKITLAEAAAYTGTLDLSNKSISNADGLEAFTGVTEIKLKGNNITNIDKLTNATTVAGKSKTGKVAYFAKAATQLQILDVSDNKITNIDATQLKHLTNLNVSGNNLTSLLLNNGNNAALITLDATNNASLGCIQTDANFTPPNTWLKGANTIYSSNCNAALSVTSENLHQFVRLYPNPVTNVLNITTANTLEIKTVEIYNTLGKRVLTTKTISINTSNLSKGLYLTKIITNKGVVSGRFIKE